MQVAMNGLRIVKERNCPADRKKWKDFLVDAQETNNLGTQPNASVDTPMAQAAQAEGPQASATSAASAALAGEPFIVAEGLGLKTPLGTPYLDINAKIPLGSFVAVTGDHGAGKTPLVLTFAGRMRFNRGSLTIDGHKLPHGDGKVRKIAGLGLFKGLNEFEANLKVRSVAASELDLFHKPHRKADVQSYLESWDLGHTANTKVRDLSEPELVRLGIALGMAGEPKILAVDDVEHSLNHDQTRDLVELLKKLVRDRNMIVVLALTEPSFATDADLVIPLERNK